MKENRNNQINRSGHQKRPQGGGNRPFQGRRSGAGSPQTPTIEKITAPYNFVPLSRKVFFPDWSQHVSHDLPFADGISGELVCELVTDTPVYVRNGGKWEHNDIMTNEEAQSFFRVGEQIMIPGTTLKGILRNVIEIASFGKMNKVDDHRYGVRDLQNFGLYGKHLTVDLGNRTYKSLSMAGWLSQDKVTGEWQITPCDYARVDHKELGNPGLHGRQSALKKYALWGEDRLSVRFDCADKDRHSHSDGKWLVYRKATCITGGKTPGTLVFTGQPAPNDGRHGTKHMEFIFYNERRDKIIAVSKTIKKEFEFIHSDTNEIPNEEWAYWKRKLSEGNKVPVFYLTNPDGSLHSFGLAMMYRLPYANSVKQAIEHSSKDHFSACPDLAETIFGYVDDTNAALKGRVFVTPAIAIHAEAGKREQTVLGAPKPSFYPNYLEQPNPGSGYKTFMDDDCIIRGWKRYPARKPESVHIPQGVGEKVDTRFIPLKEKARFIFKVKLHNLRPIELGAVAWALTWGGDNRLRHSLGMGKSMGFGLASITITSADVDWKGAMSVFEAQMNKEVGGSWLKSAQMEQLLAMANPAITPQCGSLRHLFLAPGSGNEFVQAKRAKKTLLPHVRPTALPDSERFKNLKPRQADAALSTTDHSEQTQSPKGRYAKAAIPAATTPPDLSALEALRNKFKKS